MKARQLELSPHFRGALALFIALNLMDFCTTASILSLGGREIMPVAKAAIDGFGTYGLFVHKFFIALGIGCLCRNFTEKWWDLLNGLLAGVVAWNTVQLCLFVYATTCGIPA